MARHPLQTLAKPRLMLGEMLRVGRQGIVSFPNFARWRVVVNLVAHCRMPMTERLPYPWYDSDNIHPFTLQDLLDWVKASGLRIVSGHSFSEGSVRTLRPEDNLHAKAVLVVVESKVCPTAWNASAFRLARLVALSKVSLPRMPMVFSGEVDVATLVATSFEAGICCPCHWAAGAPMSEPRLTCTPLVAGRMK
jgi:hypothetical protein